MGKAKRHGKEGNSKGVGRGMENAITLSTFCPIGKAMLEALKGVTEQI